MLLDPSEVKSHALALGFQSVGVCAAQEPAHFGAYRTWLDKGYHGEMGYLARHLKLKSDPSSLLAGAKSVVAVAMNYNRPPSREGKPRIARYALGRDYHRVMRARLKQLEAFMRRSSPGSRSRACVDSAPIMERDFAQSAGLGFYGKNTMLIDPKRGSWFFIGLILTTDEFQPDVPATGTCGTCTRCIDACPTGAIVYEDGRWQIDARRCISYLTIEHRGSYEKSLEKRVGDWVFGCDVCQEVCPFNEPRLSQPLRAAYTTEAAFATDREWPAQQELIEADWDRLTRGSAVRRAGHAGWLRNVRVAASNLANRS